MLRKAVKLNSTVKVLNMVKWFRFNQPRLSLTMRNKKGRMTVRNKVTVKVLMIVTDQKPIKKYPKLKTTKFWPFEVIGHFIHLF